MQSNTGRRLLILSTRVTLILIGGSVLFQFVNCDHFFPLKNGDEDQFNEEIENNADDGISNSNASGGNSSGSKPWVFVLAGQSNMVGQGQFYDYLKNEKLAKIPPNVEFYVANRRVADWDHQQDLDQDGVSEFGPEISFVSEIGRLFPSKKIIGIKYAVNGTSLAQWLPKYQNNQGQTITQNDPLYLNLLAYIRSAVNRRDVEYKAMLWMQGESDALEYSSIGRSYQANLSALIESIRTDLGEKDLAFIFGRIYRYAHLPLESVVGIRSAQERLAKQVKNIFLLSTDNFVLSDTWHFNGTGQFSLGKCFATIFNQAVILKQSVDLYNCPLASGLDLAPVLTFSDSYNGPAQYYFPLSRGGFLYSKAENAGSDPSNIEACLEVLGSRSCELDQAKWTQSAPWTYDASSSVWRSQLPISTFPANTYRGWWRFKDSKNISFTSTFNTL
ncbi:MAG: hypothetical protein IPJ71_18240 [Bdellovibrionales bacterium]|nr:hypothetical protein [Bdellovibrionales bacterium]